MQVVCRSAEVGSDVCCPVCGQGFLLYWTRRSPQDQPVLMSVLMDVLGRQHALCAGADAHGTGLAFGEMSGLLPSATPLREAQWGYC